ncbi:MAG: hypothetical protein KBS81_05675, partial [Spirochaetales bacterium]|nr:hypothetical protein [Candidatus Physcosoma equi]
SASLPSSTLPFPSAFASGPFWFGFALSSSVPFVPASYSSFFFVSLSFDDEKVNDYKKNYKYFSTNF